MTTISQALILDFDGTITEQDLGDMICDRFAAPDWRTLDDAWERGELSLFEAQRQMWGTIRTAGEAVLAYAREAGRLRGGIDDLLAAAEQTGTRLVIASGGFNFYIDAVLGDRLGRFDAVLCNEATLTANGIDLAFPLQERFGCPRCAVCKGHVCDHYRALGHRVIYVGDGNSDRCAVGRADTLAAVRGSKLAGYAAGSAIEFDQLSELIPLLTGAGVGPIR